MRPRDVFVSRELRFSLGVEEASGRDDLSIPVANGMVDYEEHDEPTAPRSNATASTLPPPRVSWSAAAPAKPTSC